MSVRVHVTVARASDAAISILGQTEVDNLYGVENEIPHHALVIEDTLNCHALVLNGTDEEFAQLAHDILHRLDRLAEDGEGHDLTEGRERL